MKSPMVSLADHDRAAQQVVEDWSVPGRTRKRSVQGSPAAWRGRDLAGRQVATGAAVDPGAACPA